jgi:CubicO group peptidase (beta-lactamase class C family)
MVRLVVAVLVVSIGVLLAMKPLFNIAPTAIDDAIDVATGLGAKLACSGRFISGLERRRIKADLTTYSPAYGVLDITYDHVNRRTTADLLGLSRTSASYRLGLGCTLDRAGAEQLDQVVTRVVPPSSDDWPAGSGADSIDRESQLRLQSLLEQDNVEGYDTRALALVRDGRLVAEAYAPGFETDTPLLGWSMGKSLTAILIGALERDGLLAPGQSILYPEWAADERRSITLENLLQMSSGLAFEEVYAPGSDATYMLASAISAAAVAKDKPLVHPPGSHFAYSSGTTNLLAELYQRTLGGTTQQAWDYLFDELLEPLSMAETIVEPDPSGVFVGSSFVYASARDWARLGQLMLAGGELLGQRVLSEDWVRRATRPNGSRNDPRYGYQFWLNTGGDTPRWPELPADAYAMLGNRSQVVMVIPSRNTVIVRLGWSATEYPTSAKLASLLD